MRCLCVDEPASLAERVESTASEFDLVVAAGGDGTVGAVAAGLHRARRDGAEHVPPLAVLPLGTGNDFARQLDMSRDPVQALDAARAALAAGRRRWIDLIGCSSPQLPGERRYALNAVVGGLGGKVADVLTPAIRRRWGHLAYLRAVIPELLRWRSQSVVLHVDGRRFASDALTVVIANGRFAGGGIPLAPSAAPDDGRIDIVVIARPSILRVAPLLLRVLRGRHGGSEEVLQMSGRRVSLEADGDFWMNLDGETWAAGPASFDLVPRALEVLLP